MYSILYPVIDAPPSFAGADQNRLTCVGETAVAARLVGGSGAFAALASPEIDNKIRTDEIDSTVRFLIFGLNCAFMLIKTRTESLVNGDYQFLLILKTNFFFVELMRMFFKIRRCGAFAGLKLCTILSLPSCS